MTTSVLRANKISKKFAKSIKKSMLYGVSDISKSFLNMTVDTENLREGEFWAVDQIDFTLSKGEVLGIIGSNGSGKSTLLKMLNGIFYPDRGSIEICGRTGALIEVGAGFHPVLTGKENIYINGAILGMGRKEIDRIFDRIVKFADIGDFLDTPVKNYSSGMRVRLGFSIAIHSQPDILLIDEVLAVGDVQFQEKSLNKIKKLKSNGTSIILVSHSITKILTLTDRVLVMDKSKQKAIGDPMEMVNLYQDMQIGHTNGIGNQTIHHPDISIKKVVFFQDKIIEPENGTAKLKVNSDFKIQIEYLLKCSIRELEISFGIYKSDIRLSSMSTFNFNNKEKILSLPESGRLTLSILNPRYYPGKYKLTITIKEKSKTVFLCKEFQVCNFVIQIPDDGSDKDRYANIFNCIDQESNLDIELID